MSDLETVESLKTEGNKFFNQKDYKKAEELYTSAIEKSEEPNCILFTNRAAARYELGKYSEAIEDCDRAVFINSSWTKAYFRKSSALDKIPETSRRSKYSVWHQAMKYCDPTPLLHKHYEAAKKSWLPYYKTEAVEDTEDFLERISLLKDSREKLSTMAHLWNESSPEERFHHFCSLLNIIGGEGEKPGRLHDITPELMKPMPLHNYEDMPRENIESWCIWFSKLSKEEKTNILEKIWKNLSGKDQTAVLEDLKLFVGNALSSQEEQESSKIDVSNEFEDS